MLGLLMFLLLSGFAFGDDGMTEAAACAHCGPAASRGLARLPTFGAAEFFELRAGDTYSPRLPDRVNFEPVRLSQESLRGLLIGSWRGGITCGGRRLNLSDMEGTRYMNGVTAPFVMKNFLESGNMEVVHVRGSSQEENVPVRRIDGITSWTLGNQNASGGFSLKFGRLYSEQFLSAARIRETGEIVLLDGNPSLEDAMPGVCRPGERAYQVMIKIPTS